ncbi:hypothetical protein [Microlunatus speluncae]|uniref:hypothetical protein n=1 Tax=Microlunatus speluncae TaxID=2594267 RepID=UPI001C2D9357|nr:hypothetical protein [Microlunatus speluncae]
MTAGGELDLRPITTADVGGVAAFLRAELNGRLSVETWAAAIVPPWPVEAPNHGFLLAAGDRIVGVQLAVYSERLIMGRPERICNLAAWCVIEEYRIHGVRLLRSALAQPGYTFTDLSPSGNVLEVNRRLRFTEFDTRSVLLPNVPKLGRSSIDVTGSDAALAGTLTGDDLRHYQDHRGCLAARQVLIRSGTEHCHVIYRKDRRKGISAFASILYASDPELLQRALPDFRSYLIRRDRLMATLAEIRLVGHPNGAVDLPETRRKMFRSDRLDADQLDYLYSELTCVPW